MEKENLLSSLDPSTNPEEFRKLFTRKVCDYEDKCDPFRIAGVANEYGRQYSHIYFARLSEMSEVVVQKAKKKWGEENVCMNLSELSNMKGHECIITGTIFKQMDLRPSILKEISAKYHLAPPPPRSRYVSATDKLILEDHMQRVILKWEETEKMDSSSSLTWSQEEELVTGVVAAVLGQEGRKGEFLVNDICYAGPPPVVNVDETSLQQNDEDKYVLLLSGLNLGSSWCDQLSTEMMVDYVTGQLGGAKDHDLCSSIVRVIVAGNSITDKPIKSSLSQTTRSRFLTRNYSAESLEAMKELDSLLDQLSSCVPVDLMPGSHDPTNFLLPQQPMHKCMFPKASRHQNLKGVTNPYAVSIGGTNLVGTSGQNVTDICRFTVVTDSLHILENTLHWSHLAPTAPDTLACYPYDKKDPFILKDCPQVYFAGNQPKFQKKCISVDGRPVLLICVPSFDMTHSCVLVNLRSLDCKEIKFATSMDAMPSISSSRLGDEESDADIPEEEDMSILNHMDNDDDSED